jgi:hypothetical protein
MRQITLDDDLRAKLGDLSDEIALCDADGRVVAYVMAPQYREAMYDMAANLVSDEELRAASREYAEKGGLTTAQVLAHLQSLDHPEKMGA